MPVSSDLPIGSELLGYRIDGVLGRGGMGIVYLAEDRRLKRRVALKLLSPELAEDERFRERLLAESEIAASLDHPNVVPIYEAGEVDGLIFISMRYVEGRDLKAVLRASPLSPERALDIVSQVASALDAAHARGLVHRDVKPSNVLIASEAGHDGGDHVYLADFGLTRRRSDTGQGGGDERSLGTFEYVAPEQIRGEELDGRADVYSLGCLLYECLEGEPPFAGRSDAATLFAHLDEDPPTLPGLEAVLPKTLAKDRDERYGTCRELVDAARAGLGLSSPERRSRGRGLALAIGALVVATAVVGAFLVRSGGSSASTATGRLARIDPQSNEVVRTLDVGQDPSGLAVGGGHVWITSLPDSALWRVDPKTGETKRIAVSVSVPIGVAASTGLAFGEPIASAVRGTLAFVSGGSGVSIVSATPGQDTGRIATGDATAIASGPAGVWVMAGTTADRLVSTSFGIGKTAQAVPLPPAGPDDEAHNQSDPAGIAVGEGGVWVLGDETDRQLWRIDPARGKVTKVIALPFAPGGVAAGLGGVWVTAQLDDRVLRIDPTTGRVVATIPVGRAPWGVATGAGGVWVANTVDGTVSHIDPASNRVVATIPVQGDPEQVAVGGNAVWVAGHVG